MRELITKFEVGRYGEVLRVFHRVGGSAWTHMVEDDCPHCPDLAETLSGKAVRGTSK